MGAVATKSVTTKADLIDGIVNDANISKAEATEAFESILRTITGALVKGDQVSVPGFGRFAVSDRKARVGRNPQTGAELQIPASKGVGFKAGKNLKEAVNA